MFRNLLVLGMVVSLIGLGILLNLDSEAKAALIGTKLPDQTTPTSGTGGQGGGGFGGGGRGGQGGGGGGFGGPPTAAASSSDQNPNVRMSGYGLIISGLILVVFANIITPRLPEPGEEEEVAPPA